MAKLFILIKRKGSKRFLGVIPAKDGVSKATLTKQLRKNIKKGFIYKIVTIATLKRVINKQKPKGKRVRRIKRKIRSRKPRRIKRRKRRLKRKSRKGGKR